MVSAIMNMGGQLGGACSASLTPLIAAHIGWEMSFVTAACIAALGAAGWLIIDPMRACGEAGTDPMMKHSEIR